MLHTVRDVITWGVRHVQPFTNLHAIAQPLEYGGLVCTFRLKNNNNIKKIACTCMHDKYSVNGEGSVA